MFKKIKIQKWHFAFPAIVGLFVLGAATYIGAQERKPARNAEEIQAQIDRLNAELQQVKEQQKNKVQPNTTLENVPQEKMISGNYLGMEGDDWIGIVIGQPNGNVFPITIYEDGLPDHGYNPKDDDKYIGTLTAETIDDKGIIAMNITLTQKFDELREEPVEQVLRELKASLAFPANQKEMVITIPRNREWGAVRVVKQFLHPVPVEVFVSPTFNLVGRYLGFEGDDRIGMVLTPANEEPGKFNVVFYEDGLPGAGYNRRDDDRYEGTATFRGNALDIRLTKKFDEDRAERVERVLQQLTGAVRSERDGAVQISIPRNPEWDGVTLKKL